MTKLELLDVLIECRIVAKAGAAAADASKDNAYDAGDDADLCRCVGAGSRAIYASQAAKHAKEAAAACRKIRDLLGTLPVSLDFDPEG
jgi:hypothetical protein